MITQILSKFISDFEVELTKLGSTDAEVDRSNPNSCLKFLTEAAKRNFTAKDCAIVMDLAIKNEFATDANLRVLQANLISIYKNFNNKS
jgi:hypothetical protein